MEWGMLDGARSNAHQILGWVGGTATLRVHGRQGSGSVNHASRPSQPAGARNSLKNPRIFLPFGSALA
jgi:hypothetical protein